MPAQLKLLRNRIGMVSQSHNLWPHMTVLENVIEAPLRVRKMPRKLPIDEAEVLLSRVGLYKKWQRYPARLSGGQRRWVAIARALAIKPQVMLFDEVTSALNLELVARCYR